MDWLLNFIFGGLFHFGGDTHKDPSASLNALTNSDEEARKRDEARKKQLTAAAYQSGLGSTVVTSPMGIPLGGSGDGKTLIGS